MIIGTILQRGCAYGFLQSLMFDINVFEEFLAPIVTALVSLTAEADILESKRRISTSLITVIERAERRVRWKTLNSNPHFADIRMIDCSSRRKHIVTCSRIMYDVSTLKVDWLTNIRNRDRIWRGLAHEEYASDDCYDINPGDYSRYGNWDCRTDFKEP
jgi:hypothetical protein